jgi:3-isopropylmalate/(R)-2-methylmalate dehydratase small subunit
VTINSDTRLVAGRVWKFGDNVDTDALYPAHLLRLKLEEAAAQVFSEIRPGWAAEVAPGDIIVAGQSFGIGSSRPAAALLKILGITCVIADDINSLFLRNCINSGLAAINLPRVTAHFDEGQMAEADLSTGTLTNKTTGWRGEFAALPDFVMEIVAHGGLLNLLRNQGLLAD